MAIEDEAYLRQVDKGGRIVIPKNVREHFQIGEDQVIEITVRGDKILLEKYTDFVPCAVTGVSKKSNQKIAGVTLSPEGMEILERELAQFRSQKKSP